MSGAARAAHPSAAPSWPHRLARRILGLSVVLGALVLAAVLASVAPSVLRGNATLIAGSDFTITSTISSSAAVQAPDVLYPGVPRYLWYTVHNPLDDAISVTSLTTALDSAYPVPPTCPASNLDLSQVGFTGSLTVPPHGTNTVSRPIALRDTGVNQDGCKSVTFHFTYSGSATYTHLYATTVTLTSAPNPAAPGQPVTFTATVAPVGTPPSGPTGTVTFVACPTVACTTSTPLGTGTVGPGGTTTFTTSTLPAGTVYVQAIYTPADAANFSAASSNVVTQVVGSTTSATSTVLVSAPNPSTWGQTVTFTATVSPAPGSGSGTPTGQVTFFDGTTPLGSASLDAAGKATFTTSTLAPGTHPVKAAYAGDPTHGGSTSNVVNQVVNYTSCITGTRNGGLVVLSGQWVCVATTGRVNGGIGVMGGGRLSVFGTVNGHIGVQPGGWLEVRGGTVDSVGTNGAIGVTFCAATVKGSLGITASTTLVVIGGTPGCPGNTLNGGIGLNLNHAGYTVGGNKISGTVAVTANTGTGTISANTIKGSLACTVNNPPPGNNGQHNSVTGQRTGQCGSAGF